MQRASDPEILIVGGGIAGLTLSIGLGRHGIRANIVEINRQWNVLGVGLSLTGPTLRALRSIGLLDPCISAAFGFSKIVICDGSGALLDEVQMPSLLGPDYPAMVAIGRPVLHDILLDTAVSAGCNIRLGVTVASIREASDSVFVTFSDGAEAAYDLVVGADGFHSRVRDLCFPDADQPHFTGLAVWRASMPRAPEINSMHMFYGPENKAGLNPVSQREMFLFLVQSISDGRRPAQQDFPHLLRRQLRGFGGILAGIRDAIDDPDKIDYRPMDALLLKPPWVRGRVLLIGDAAHTTTPHLATGAGIAIEDAVVLAELLASGRSVEECIAAFMERRYERCRLVVETSITLGDWEKDPAIPVADHVALMKNTFAKLAAPI